MEPANINWKRIESRFVRDEVYERINAPKWADLSSPDHSVVDDEAWFCRPDCRHPKTAEDFRRLSPSLKVKQMRSTPETLPLGQRNGNQRDGYLKRRGGGIAALLSSSSFREAPRPKVISKKLHEDLENQDPNVCSKNTATPPASCSKAVPKMVKEAIKSSSEKSREEAEEEWRHNKPAPRLRSTLSARNLFAGKDILGQISEFCQEIKKLIVMKEDRPSAAQEEVKKEEGMQKKVLEEAPKGLNTNSNSVDSKRKGGLVKKGGMVLRVEKVEEKCKKSADENSPLLKREAVRSCPPTPQRFPSPATRRLRNSKTSVVTSSPLKTKTPERGILRELVQQGSELSEEKKALVAMDENNASSVPDETEGRSLDVFWFLKPCSYLSK